MSLITVQLGQCGNQVGTEFFDLLMKDATEIPKYSSLSSWQNQDYKQQVMQRFFTEEKTKEGNNESRYVAKSIMIDTEPKVINKCFEQADMSGKWCFRKENVCCKKRGSGNNWAHGYQRYGSEVQDKVVNLARQEAEKCDWFSGFLVTMSLAGGTGSGLGAYLTHSLHDYFQDVFVVNQVVWPYSTGEVILQNYNTVLTLSHLYQSSDGVIILQNDYLDKICTKLLGLKHVSFHDINRIISHKLASALQPAFSDSCVCGSNTLGNIVSSLCSHPAYKLLTIKNVPQLSVKSMEYTTFVWSSLVKHLRQMLIADAALDEGIDWDVKVPSFSHASVTTSKPRERQFFNKSISNALIIRGKDLNDAQIGEFADKNIYANWVPESSRLSVWNQPRPFDNYEKSATLISNSQSFVNPLDNVTKKAWNMFASRAYIHQYNKYGLTDDDFVDSFGYVEQILADYKTL